MDCGFEYRKVPALFRKSNSEGVWLDLSRCIGIGRLRLKEGGREGISGQLQCRHGGWPWSVARDLEGDCKNGPKGHE